MRRLQYIPWIPLLQVSGLTVFFATILDLLVITGVQTLGINLGSLLSPISITLLSLAISLGIGALGVYLMERLFTVPINATVLWCLILCLALFLIVKSWLSIPIFLVGSDRLSLIGLLVGVFWKGAYYWRR